MGVGDWGLELGLSARSLKSMRKNMRTYGTNLARVRVRLGVGLGCGARVWG